MKQAKHLIFVFLLLATVTVRAQVGIGTTTPAASAQLDVSSTTKGFLPPRMTHSQRNEITSPVARLMVWCSNCGSNGEMQVYNGTAWTNMVGNPATLPPPVPPTVITTAMSGINSTSAISGGNVTSDGYSAVTVRGVCWDIAANPTVALPTKTNNGTGTGIFVSNITGLTLGITYYVRAYATNAIGTSYGAEFSFTTAIGIGDSLQGGIIAYILQPGDPGYIAGQTHGLIAAAIDQSTGSGWGCYGTAIPGADGTTLGTGNQNTIDIMAGCATAGIAARLCGDLVLNGYSDWYLPSKDELNKLYINQAAVGGFSSGIYWSSSEGGDGHAWLQFFSGGSQSIGLKGSAYRVRAVRAFTPTNPVPPTVFTTAISGITSTSAVSGGNVTFDGYSNVTVRGVCWDIAPNPTVALPTKTNNGTGTGIFVSNITGLTLGITYYVRAYATNAIGTSYGAEFSFTTAIGIGSSHQGGIIAYILQPGDPGYIAGQTHGLIAAASDQSAAAEWGCYGTPIPGADGTTLGTGNQNTIDIMAGCATAGIAARICGDLVLNGFSDWYLPSKDELNKLYINRVAVGGFSSGGYWSSSEITTTAAFLQDFNGGGQFSGNKNNAYQVRAVRAF